jgi:hypothetical protein
MATEDIRYVASPLQAAHALAVRAMRRLQVATGPGCESEDGGAGPAPQMIVGGDEVERPTSMVDGLTQITKG